MKITRRTALALLGSAGAAAAAGVTIPAAADLAPAAPARERMLGMLTVRSVANPSRFMVWRVIEPADYMSRATQLDLTYLTGSVSEFRNDEEISREFSAFGRI